MTSARVRRPELVLCAVALAFVAACGGDDGSAGQTPSATETTVSTSQGATTRPECATLATRGQALVDTATQFVNGQATGEQVRVAAQDLAASIETARTVVGADVAASLDEAQAALGRVRTALATQPPDLAAVRAAANDTLAALRDAVRLCQASPSGSPTSG